MAKFGATMPPTFLALHAVSSLSMSALDSPVVPTTGEAPAATVSPTSIAATEAALARRRRRGGKGCRHHLGIDLLFDGETLGGQLLDGRLTAQVEPALAVDLDGLDHDLVPDVADLLDALDAVVGELGDVDEPVLVRQHLDKSSERHDADDLRSEEHTS